MRICIVSQEYPPDTDHGGIAAQARAKAEGLARRGHDVTVVSRSVKGVRQEAHPMPGLAVVRLPGPDSRMPVVSEAARWVLWSAEVAEAVAAIGEQEPWDLVEFAEYGAEGYVHLLNQSPWSRTRTVLHLHGPLVMLSRTLGWPDPDDELARAGVAMEGTCVRLADEIYSSSACTAAWCAEEFGLDEQSTPTLHMGVDTSHFRPVPMDGGPATIAFVGKLTRAKGIEILVRATLAIASDYPGLRLRLIGRDEGGILADLLREARAAGQPDMLDVRGHVGADGLPAALAGATLFASPSFYEGGPGLTFLEAMACGLPVIAPADTGSAEVVIDGETGLLVQPRDEASLACALRRLLDDPAAAAAMGDRARSWVTAEADRAVCLDRLEKLYEDAVAGIPWQR